MYLIITLFIVLGATYLFTHIGKKMRIPSVVALILCGLFLDIPFFKNLLIYPHSELIFFLGDIALLFLMFLAGLESSWRSLYKERKDATILMITCSIVPFLLGYVSMRLLGFEVLVAMIVGICLSITAEATNARVLMELRKIKSKVGSAIMGAGIIDDIFGLSLFIIGTYIFKASYLQEDLIIAGAIAAFFLGLLVQKKIGRKHHIIGHTEKVILWFIIPFFFISIGMHFDMNALILNPVLLTVIIIIAIAGKLLGSFFAKPFTKFSWKQLHLIGWAMNSRGAVEMALAFIAFRTGLIPTSIYSSLIIMALVTTAIFPFIITSMIKENPKIMN